MDPLFELIKSLTKSEKVHFKKYASMHSYKTKAPQLVLYDLLEKASVFEESKYKNKIGPKKYALAKFSLYDLVQKSLRNFHEKGTDFMKAMNFLQSIEIMIAKNLISHAETLNQKAKKIALENEDYFLLCKILQNELKFLTAPKKVSKTNNPHQEIFSAFEDSIEQLRDLGQTLVHLSELVIPIRQTYDIKNELHEKIVIEAKRNSTNLIAKENTSIWVKLNCYRIQGVLAGFEGNVEANIEANQKIVAYLESKPTFLENNPRGIFGAYRNLFGASIQGKKWKLAEEIIDKLQDYLSHKTIVKNKKVKAYILETYLSAAGYLLAIRPDIDSIYQEKFALYKESLKEHESLINSLREDSIIVTHYYLGIISFRLKDYAGCLQNINQFKILKRDSNRFIRIEASILVLQLLCLYETEEVEVAENLLRSIQRSENSYLEDNTLISESLNFVKKAIKGEVYLLDLNLEEVKPSSELDIALKEWLINR